MKNIVIQQGFYCVRIPSVYRILCYEAIVKLVVARRIITDEYLPHLDHHNFTT